MPQDNLPSDIYLATITTIFLMSELPASLLSTEISKFIEVRCRKYSGFHRYWICPADAAAAVQRYAGHPSEALFSAADGFKIEVLLPHPISPASVEEAMIARGKCVWQCVIATASGGRKVKPFGWCARCTSGTIYARLSDPKRNWIEFTREDPDQSGCNT